MINERVQGCIADTLTHGLSPNDRFGIKNKRFYFGIVFVFTIFANIKVKTRQIIIK